MALIQESAKKLYNNVWLPLRGRRDMLGTESNIATALHRAVQKGDKEGVVNLQNEDNANAEDVYGRIAMHYAAHNGDVELARALVETKDMDRQDKLGRTALHWAADNNHIQMVKFLLDERKTNINVQDHSRQTALSRAAWRGWSEVVELLLKHKAAYHLPDQEGNTPLHLAVNNEHNSVAELLFTRVINDDSGRTYERVASAAEETIEKCWNDVVVHLSGRTIRWAARNNHMGVFDALLRKGIQADTWLEDLAHRAPFELVANEGNLDMK
ncbi:hypothetical protein O1611_g7901 [Lasiodiplodia mahajangana]|uniref:Uncharacterized protein n=1 Tax=Lasiodiplodia mahajangana TaxID=1108764 RepID=A0ACC2JET0_9PEZI|nr:hypothetical protein O1611_g7901 [Lasiodiplodia mahajangana]